MRSPQHHHEQLVISAAAVNGPYGTHPAALLGGISTRLSCRSKAPGLQINGPDQTIETPFWAATEEFPAEIPAELRLQLLCQGALENLPAPTDAAATLIVNLLPEEFFLQDEQLFRKCLETIFPNCETSTLRQYPVEQSATSILAEILEDFRQGPWKQLIFGSSDCLNTTTTLLNAIQQRNCCSDLNPDHRLLGEGAAYLVIDKVANASTGQIVITALAHQHESNHGHAASKATGALATCIQTCLTNSGLTSNQLEAIISGYVPDMSSALEWNQTERNIWPETSRLPKNVEELNPQLGCGDCGSAALPLALALAYARFDFKFIPVTTLMVCDISPKPYRGAICLKRTKEFRYAP